MATAATQSRGLRAWHRQSQGCKPCPWAPMVQAPMLAHSGLRAATMHALPQRAIHSLQACHPRRLLICKSSNQDQPGTSVDKKDDNTLFSVGMGVLFLALAGYAFVLSPNQTPYRDQIFLKLLVGLREPGEDFIVNQVYTSVFNCLGIWPLLMSCLLIPAGRSANKVPAWPFVTASFAMGMFALIPYFALWRPIPDQQLPPPKEELEGWNKLVMKGAETPVLPAILLAGGVYQIYLAATAGDASWLDYGRLLEESRLIHVSSLDFMLFTAFAPFWMYNDAEARKWEQRDTLIPVLSCLPLVGTAIYLILRPKTKTD